MESLSSNELRIGNYASDGKTEYAIQNGWELDEGIELFGIPLTEEWLERMGFSKGVSTLLDSWYKDLPDTPNVLIVYIEEGEIKDYNIFRY